MLQLDKSHNFIRAMLVCLVYAIFLLQYKFFSNILFPRSVHTFHMLKWFGILCSIECTLNIFSCARLDGFLVFLAIGCFILHSNEIYFILQLLCQSTQTHSNVAYTFGIPVIINNSIVQRRCCFFFLARLFPTQESFSCSLFIF